MSDKTRFEYEMQSTVTLAQIDSTLIKKIKELKKQLKHVRAIDFDGKEIERLNQKIKTLETRQKLSSEILKARQLTLS